MRFIPAPRCPFPARTEEEWHGWYWPNTWYRRFVHTVATQSRIGLPVLFQKEPCFRVHPPGGTAVDWHTDADFGHLPEEWNVWVPLSVTKDDSQRLWIDDGTTKFPVRVQPGEAFMFRGATTRHGNFVNTTDEPRFSFDFRLLAKADYRDTGAKTVKYGVPMRLGDYWEEME